MRTANASIPIAIVAVLVSLPILAAEAGFAPVLSEMMASNESALADEDGEFSDWIEVQNSGDAAGNLAGWFLSDDSASLTRWTFPPTPLGAGEFLVIFASGKNRAVEGGELHANFKLGKRGEFLALTMPDGMSSVSAFDPSYPPQFTDISWGAAGYFSQATPGMANSAAGSGPINAVEFDPGSQVFTNSLSIMLSSATAGATIIFTTDGSEPSSANGSVYNAPFSIGATTEIRARAQLSDEEVGPITLRKYLKLAADTQAFSSPLPIVVLDNFGSGAVPKRNTSTGPNGNDGSGVIQVERQGVLMAIYDRGESGQASPADQPAIVSNGGIRVRGSSSGGLAKKSFSLETWEDGTVEENLDISPFGMPSEADWVLYAPTETFSSNRYDRPLLHNSFIYQVSNQIGRYAARTQFVEVFLNTGGGELEMSDYAGLYIFMEQRKRGRDRIEFSKLNQDGTDGGWMISVDRMDPLPIGGVGTPRHFHTPGPNGVLQTADDSPFGVRGRDDRPEAYHSFFNFESPGGYDINTDQRGVIQEEMSAFEDALYGLDWKDPELGYAAHIDVDSFIDQFILHNLTKNQDAFVLSTLLYRDSAPDKIKFGPIWDFDRGYTTSPTSTNPSANLLWAANRMWYPRLFADLEFEQKYIDRWQELRDGTFATDYLHAIIDAQKAEITEEVALRNGTSSWSTKVTAMKNWLATRTAAIDAQFVPMPIFNQDGGSVAAGYELTMLGANGTTVYYTVDGSDPRLPGSGVSPQAIAFDGGPSDTELFPFETDCRYFIPADDSLGLDWTGDPDAFDDSGWGLATPGFGWENLSTGALLAAVNTDIKSEMKGQNASGYFRWEFDFDNAANINSITLRVKIDDGFVAYLNGVEIGKFEAPDPTGWNSAATGSRSDQTVLSSPIIVDASAFKSAVRDGSNAIAIQGMNTSTGGGDFLIDAALEINQTVVATPVVLSASQQVIARATDGGDWSGPAEATFSVGAVAASAENLVVSEIMYNPVGPTPAEISAGVLDGDQFEFIELMNISGGEIDLSGVAFVDGIEFEFAAGLSSILPPGQRILVVKNLLAFELRYGALPGRRVAGEFANETNLRDSGEMIALVDVGGAPLRSFAYDDDVPWPESADGGGFSLILDLPASNPDHGLAISWHSSASMGGAPGASGTEAFVGDPFADVDGDGIESLIEFATGSSGSKPNGSPLDISSGADGSSVLSYSRNLAAEGIEYVIEVSQDLINWGEGGIFLGETNLGDGTALIRYWLAAPNQNDSREYARLRIRVR